MNVWVKNIGALCAMMFLMQVPEAFAAVPGLPGGVSSGDVTTMLNRVMDDLAGTNANFLTLFWIFCRFIGLILVMYGIKRLTKREGIGGGITVILIGALLIALPDTLAVMNQTLFETAGAASLMTSAAKTGKLTATAAVFVNFAIMMIQIVGFFALYRGIKSLADVALTSDRGHQPDVTRAAWLFIISGVICINIVATLGIMAETLGGQAKTFYGSIFGGM